MSKDYYNRFGIILGNPLFHLYLKWAYNQGLKDVESLGLHPDFNKERFSCLLSGCGNEQTADAFIQFVTRKNKQAKIYIIDLGNKQIKAIRKLVALKYKYLNIKVHQINALDLKKMIKPLSLDWIETDGFMEYFDRQSLEKLLGIWHLLLKQDGFITTRDCVTEGKLTQIADFLRVSIAKQWLGIKLFPHTKQDFEKLFLDIGFKHFIDDTWLYTYRRFALVKKISDKM